jgi:hypothetical protein
MKPELWVTSKIPSAQIVQISQALLPNRQCSRLKLSYEFHFECLSNFNLSVEGLVQIQVTLNLCMNSIVHVSSTMWRIKNQPSNCISCNDNALHLLVLVVAILYWGLQVTSSFSTEGCVLKGCFQRGIICRAKTRLKGIKDFNLETFLTVPCHWQSWVKNIKPEGCESIIVWPIKALLN